MIKAVETRIYGCRFRSRLEARWAVFLTKLGVQWEYEKEGYMTEAGWYLPDFWLPEVNGGSWLEIKPYSKDAPHIWQDPKLYSFQCSTPHDYFVAHGLRNPTKKEDLSDTYYPGWIECTWDEPMYFCECPICGKIGIVFDGRSARLDDCDTTKAKQEWVYRADHEDKAYTANSPRIIEAFIAANSARFEHGEKP